MTDASDDLADRSTSGPSQGGKVEGLPEADQTTECPACGRRFAGDYCPSCGQEADPSVRVGDVVGDFVRELTDLRGGLLDTLVGLTLRPGRMLRSYLGGVRAELMSPGRYLLVSIVTLYFVGQGLIWMGIMKPPEAVAATSIEGLDGGADPRAEAMITFFESYLEVVQAQWFLVAQYLAAAVFLSLVLRRLFSQKLRQSGEALAISAYIVGHFNFLWATVNLAYAPTMYFLAGHPVGAQAASGNATGIAQPGIGFFVLVLYAGAVFYDFDGNWRSAVKGAAGTLWSFLEAAGCLWVLAGVVLLWRLRPLADVPQARQVYLVLSVVAVVFLLPALLHAAVEGYYRVR